jgi:hypothetical protein
MSNTIVSALLVATDGSLVVSEENNQRLQKIPLK